MKIDKSKKIGLDGIIFSLQKSGGISVYFRELIKQLELSNYPMTLMLESPLRQSIESYTGVDKKIRIGRTLERYRNCRITDNIALFHSSYYRNHDKKGVPSIVTVHDFINEKYNNGIKKIGHNLQKIKAIKKAQTIICISETTKRDLMTYVDLKGNQDIHVIHNGVGECYKPLHKSLELIEKFILFVGERGGYKNFKLALGALEHLEGIRLYCVGGKSIDYDELLTVSEKTRARIKFIGRVTDEELNKLYNQAICLLYPSKYEGFGIPVVEAMKAGCPVVASNECEVLYEICGDAIIRVSEDPKIIADAITKLVEENNRVEKIQMGFEMAKSYSWEICHNKTLDLYKNYL